MTDDNAQQKPKGKNPSQAKGDVEKSELQAAVPETETIRDATDIQQKQLEPIKLLAEQLAQALTNRNAQTFTRETIAAVEKYGEIAGGLIISTQAQPSEAGETGDSLVETAP